jgi:tetratricopeptide (TPR) repeat protein
MSSHQHAGGVLEAQRAEPRTSGDALHARRSLERAQLAAALSKWRTALVLVRAALDAVPDEPAALALYGLCVARTGGDLSAALDACRQAVASQPYVAQWQAYLGSVYHAAGLAPQATACFRAALALDPHEPLASDALAAATRRARWRRWLARRVHRRASPQPV